MLSRIVSHYAIFFSNVSAEFVVGVPLTPIVNIPRYIWSDTQLVVLPIFCLKVVQYSCNTILLRDVFLNILFISSFKHKFYKMLLELTQ